MLSLVFALPGLTVTLTSSEVCVSKPYKQHCLGGGRLGKMQTYHQFALWMWQCQLTTLCIMYVKRLYSMISMGFYRPQSTKSLKTSLEGTGSVDRCSYPVVDGLGVTRLLHRGLWPLQAQYIKRRKCYSFNS